jgi:hypothetical protein
MKLKRVFCIAIIILMFKKKSSAWQTSETLLTLFTAGQILLQILAQIIVNKNATL